MTQHSAPQTRIAVAQIGAQLNSIPANTQRVTQALEAAQAQDVDLVVFPECILTGYLYDDVEAVRANSLASSSAVIAEISELHRSKRLHSVIGFLERDGDQLYNTAMLFTPHGIAGRYRKQHLPFLGADRFVSAGQGDTASVFDTSIGRIGIMICYDLRYPERARELGLQGVDVIAMPTNWAAPSTILADIVVRTRALENLVFLAVADRHDSEAGTGFIGRSQIISPRGNVLVDAGSASGVFATDVTLSDAHNKDIVIDPGVFELPVFSGRRPELYTHLTTPIAELPQQAPTGKVSR